MFPGIASKYVFIVSVKQFIVVHFDFVNETDNSPFFCSCCGKGIDRKKGQKRVVCGECGLSIATCSDGQNVSILRESRLVHTGEFRFKCSKWPFHSMMSVFVAVSYSAVIVCLSDPCISVIRPWYIVRNVEINLFRTSFFCPCSTAIRSLRLSFSLTQTYTPTHITSCTHSIVFK